MRLNWVVILLAAILLVLLLAFVVDVTITDQDSERRGAPVGVLA